MRLITRSGWGARKPVNITWLATSQQKGTGVHYSGSAAETKSDHSKCAGVVKSIQKYHMDTNGWADIAYSYLVCIHGYVFEGRGRGVRTAANGTNAGNDAYHAVCFLGGDLPNRADVTPVGRQAIKDAVNHCNAWARVHEVRPHSWFKATGCPGDELRIWIAAGMPTTTSTKPSTGGLTVAEGQDILKALTAEGTTGADQTIDVIHARVRNLEALVVALAQAQGIDAAKIDPTQYA